MLRLSIALLIAANPVFAQVPPEVRSIIAPTSSVHVRIDEARVKDLDCRGRGFKFEMTKHSARHFPYMAKATFRDTDPRSILVGVFSMILLVPVTVVSVPADLVAIPFRRECDFTLEVDGTLQEWAGRTVPNKPVSLKGRNLIGKGVQGVAPPRVFESKAASTSDANGRFSIALDGHVGGDKTLSVRWGVDSREANSMALTKSGGSFIFSEEDPGFGTGVHENPTREIVPEKKKGEEKKD
jgi:hypothetical protein